MTRFCVDAVWLGTSGFTCTVPSLLPNYDATCPSGRKVMIALEGVTVAYGETEPALRDVSMDVAKGEVVAILGPNGAGKSTLLRAMAGALPAASGSVKLEGKVVAKIERRELA